jgi:hypothetical protein
LVENNDRELNKIRSELRGSWGWVVMGSGGLYVPDGTLFREERSSHRTTAPPANKRDTEDTEGSTETTENGLRGGFKEEALGIPRETGKGNGDARWPGA